MSAICWEYPESTCWMILAKITIQQSLRYEKIKRHRLLQYTYYSWDRKNKNKNQKCCDLSDHDCSSDCRKQMYFIESKILPKRPLAGRMKQGPLLRKRAIVKHVWKKGLQIKWFLGPRGPLVLPSVGFPSVRLSVCKKNLVLFYTGIYA